MYVIACIIYIYRYNIEIGMAANSLGFSRCDAFSLSYSLRCAYVRDVMFDALLHKLRMESIPIWQWSQHACLPLLHGLDTTATMPVTHLTLMITRAK